MRTGALCAGVCLTLLSTFSISCSSNDMMPTTGTGGSNGGGTGGSNGGGTGGSNGGGTGGSNGGGTGGSSATGICATLMNYVPTTSTAPSFATDIFPILKNTDPGSANAPAPGCGQMTLCHGTPAVAINMAGTAFLSFVQPPATVKNSLLASSVNAPSMKRVDPGHVGTSFLAYKISGATGIACVNSSCPPNTTVGNTQPCGDPMPNQNGNGVAMLTDADRSKILDWIALGAND